MNILRPSKIVSRRTFGALGLAALTTSTLVKSAWASKMRPADDLFPTDEALVRALMKMRASTDGSLRFGWLEADRVAYIDGEVIPMMGLIAGTASRAKDNGDGTFDVTVLEITYYLDVESGELRPTMIMPGTGKEVNVPLYRSGPAVVNVSVSSKIDEVHDGSAGVVEGDEGGGTEAFAPKGDVKLDRSVGPAFVDGEDLWIETTEYGRVRPANPSEQPVFYKESAIWMGKTDELLDPDVHSAQTKLSYSAASSWRPWMEFGDVKGHSMAHGIGGKCSKLEDMPDQWLSLTEKHHPDFFKDPDAALRGET
jgi:hypothetical protein